MAPELGLVSFFCSEVVELKGRQVGLPFRFASGGVPDVGSGLCIKSWLVYRWFGRFVDIEQVDIPGPRKGCPIIA